MSSKQQEESLKKLIALGYSKTRAQKALKECGNVFQQAKLWLERSKEEDERKQKDAELAAKAQQLAEEQKKAAQKKRDHEAVHGPEPEDLTNVRKHPCVAQYGTCRYGQACIMKSLPWDTCINYVVGNCIFGEACRNRHTINGRDIRRLMGAVSDTHKEYYPLPNGDYVEVDLTHGGRVLEASDIYTAERYELPPAPLPEASVFSGDNGSVPTYSEPLTEPVYDIWGGNVPMSSAPALGVGPIGSPVTSHPTPFLNKVLASGGRPTDHTAAQRVVVPSTSSSATAATTPPSTFKRHPCVVQMGECRFGANCHHADMPADICVHWLNGRCRNAPGQCRWRHELPPLPGAPPTSAPAPLPSSPGVAMSPSTHGVHSPTLFADPIWGATVTPFGSNGKLGPAMDSRTTPSELWSRNFDAPSRDETARRAGAEFIAARLNPELATAAAAETGGSGGKWRQPSLSSIGSTHSSHNASPTTLLNSSPALPPPSSQAGETTSEALAFTALQEVFPDVMPDLLLAALRKCGNDRNLVAQVIADCAPENVERVLREATAEEFGLSKSLVLVTLHSMLPSMEPASLEKILADVDGDFEEAYRIAATTTEHLVASDVHCRWGGTTRDVAGRDTGYTPADQMKLDRLQGMFPDHEKFVIESAFKEAKHVTTDAISLLNRLNNDLTWVAALREEWGRKAVTKSMVSAPVSAKPAAPPAADSFTVTSSEEVSAVTSPKQTLSSQDLYHQTKQEAAEHSDWRRVRQEAYMANAARAQCVGLALAAYARGQHDVGRNLIRRGNELKREYERLNMLAMHALERERNSQHGATMSVLDLHGFHVTEALDVLTRRLEECRRNHLDKLRVIIGHGSHSKSGTSAIYPKVHAMLKEHPLCHIKSIKPAEIIVAIEHVH